MIDLDDFRDQYDEALSAANKYRSRKERGLPPDRWATSTRQQTLVAEGIAAMQAIIAMQTEVLETVFRKDE